MEAVCYLATQGRASIQGVAPDESIVQKLNPVLQNKAGHSFVSINALQYFSLD